MRALILAGGFGKRLRPFTNEMPKPMLSIAGRPLIEWQIQWLKKNGISELIVCVGYLKEKIVDYLGDGSKFGVDITFSAEESALGTGGAIKKAEPLLAGDSTGFYVINGDVLTTIDLGKLANGNANTLAAVPMKSPYGVIFTKGPNPNYVTEFLQKPVLQDIWINAGIYYFTKEIFDYLPKIGDFEEPVMPVLAKQGKLRAVRFAGPHNYWRSIDSHFDLEEASMEALTFNV